MRNFGMLSVAAKSGGEGKRIVIADAIRTRVNKVDRPYYGVLGNSEWYACFGEVKDGVLNQGFEGTDGPFSKVRFGQVQRSPFSNLRPKRTIC